MLQLHPHQFWLFHQLDFQLPLKVLHHLFQQERRLLIQNSLHCVFYQLNKWRLPFLHHLRNMWVLRLTFLRCHDCHALHDHVFSGYAAVILTPPEKVFYFRGQGLFLWQVIWYCSVSFNVDFVFYTMVNVS